MKISDNTELITPIKSFGLFEFLRYFLPGFMVIFSIAYYIFPQHITLYGIPGLIAFSLVSGFIINSIGFYKIFPKIREARLNYRRKIKKIGISNIYLHWDIIEMISSERERITFKRRFSFGTAKLDLAFVSIILSGIILFDIISFYLWGISICYYSDIILIKLIFLIFLLISATVLYSDGEKDIKRSYQLGIILAKKYNTNEYEKYLNE